MVFFLFFFPFFFFFLSFLTLLSLISHLSSHLVREPRFLMIIIHMGHKRKVRFQTLPKQKRQRKKKYQRKGKRKGTWAFRRFLIILLPKFVYGQKVTLSCAVIDNIDEYIGVLVTIIMHNDPLLISDAKKGVSPLPACIPASIAKRWIIASMWFG